MKCPYRKLKIHRTYEEEGSYAADEEVFGDCYENECPFYSLIERTEPVKVKIETCRMAERMMEENDKRRI